MLTPDDALSAGLPRQLRDAVIHARDLIEASLDAMLVVDCGGVVKDANRAAERMARRPLPELLGAPFDALFSDAAAARDALRRALADGAVTELPLVALRSDGGRTEVSCNVTCCRDAADALRGAIVVIRDCTDMRQVQMQMQFQANCDALTALPNRRQFAERVERAIAPSGGGRLTAVMLLDLDDFKDINDLLGHAAGDDLLKSVAERLGRCVRDGDTLARIGGDEFAVLLEGVALPGEIEAVAERLREAVAAPLLLEGRETAVTCSIGIALADGAGAGAAALLRSADTAMHCAKAAGKNACRHFTPDMDASVRRRVDLASRLRGALRRGELALHFQPQVRLDSGAVVGVEALLRWRTADIGAVAPDEFIPIAEDSGLILPIGAWVLEQACRQAQAWRAQAGCELAVAVNLSARQFRDADVVATVEGALAESGLPAHLLELELTESALMRDAARAAATMARLKAIGVRIAIDDFGTGYSSLSRLKRFPFDHLKIDRSFVADVPGSRSDEAIVRAVVTLAHSLGHKVITEGVECAAQMAFLAAVGCDEVQGYHVGRPCAAPDLLRLLVGRCGAPPPRCLPSTA